MRPTDGLGNVLSEGDMVIVVDGSTFYYGIVQKITENGLIAPSTAITPKGDIKGIQIPGTVSIAFLPLQIFYNSAQISKLPNITKVIKPPQFNQSNEA